MPSNDLTLATCSDGLPHRWSFAGNHEGPTPASGCIRPKRMRCDRCSEFMLVACRTARSRCAHCSERRRKLVARKVIEGMAIGPSERLYVLTLTAPGVHEHFYKGIPCPCMASGGVGDPLDRAAFNGTFAKRWNRFHQDLERKLGCRVRYHRAVEPQKRHALHAHVVMVTDRPVRVRVSMVRALAIKHGFGHELVLDSSPSERSAWYVAKYLTKVADERSLIEQVHPVTGELGSWSGRAWTSSRDFGPTLKALRQRQREWAYGMAGAAGSRPAAGVPALGGGAAGGETAETAGRRSRPLDPNTGSYTRLGARWALFDAFPGLRAV